MKKTILKNNLIYYIFFFLFFVFLFLIAQIPADLFLVKRIIIDGDSIKIKGQSIRLVGIDAPEKKQLCKKPYLSLFIFTFSKSYPCGETSTNSLKKFINDQIILCKIEEKKDFFKRYLGTCFKE